jgi:hypothetical protein
MMVMDSRSLNTASIACVGTGIGGAPIALF